MIIRSCSSTNCFETLPGSTLARATAFGLLALGVISTVSLEHARGNEICVSHFGRCTTTSIRSRADAG